MFDRLRKHKLPDWPWTGLILSAVFLAAMSFLPCLGSGNCYQQANGRQQHNEQRQALTAGQSQAPRAIAKHQSKPCENPPEGCIVAFISWAWSAGGRYLTKVRNDPVALFTGLLFVSTALLWWVTEKTLRHARSDSKRQASDMGASIAASDAANKLTQKIFAATERPWVYVTKIRVTRIIQIDNGDWLFDLMYTVKNGGRAPASLVWVHDTQGNTLKTGFDPRPFLREKAELVFGGKWHIGHMLFPGEEDSTIPGEFRITQESAQGGMRISGSGFVSYQFLTDGSPHFTNYSYSIFSAFGGNITPPDGGKSIPAQSVICTVRIDGNAN